MQVQPHAQTLGQGHAHAGFVSQRLVQRHHAKTAAGGHGLVGGGRQLALFQCLHQGRQQSRREALGHGQTHHALVGLLQQARLQVQLARLQSVGQIDAAQQPLAVHRAGNFHQPNAEAGQCLQPAFTHRAMRCPQAHAAKAVRVELQQ